MLAASIQQNWFSKWPLHNFNQRFKTIIFITARKRSCAKVMFPQVSVCLSMGWVSLVPCQGYQVPSGGMGIYRGVGTHSQTWDLKGPGIWDTTGYSRQAGSTHLTGMLSCSTICLTSNLRSWKNSFLIFWILDFAYVSGALLICAYNFYR